MSSSDFVAAWAGYTPAAQIDDYWRVSVDEMTLPDKDVTNHLASLAWNAALVPDVADDEAGKQAVLTSKACKRRVSVGFGVPCIRVLRYAHLASVFYIIRVKPDTSDRIRRCSGHDCGVPRAGNDEFIC